MPETLGLYVHIPFCDGVKCPYCDFYSVPLEEKLAEAYIKAAESSILSYAERAQGRVVDTVYFGGGTPSLLGSGLLRLLAAIKSSYNVKTDAEITLEANPSAALRETYDLLHGSGFNRLSMGMQSADVDELASLGRRHTPQDAARAVSDAKAAGFENISLDLMLATPGQTIKSLRGSIDFAAALEPEHISAYLLKIEPGTRFYDEKDTLQLPDNDAQAEYYFEACDCLADKGFLQYEISNFSKAGKESCHNLKYWNCDEYIGFGPGAHSFFGGRRFYYENSLEKFIGGVAAVDDGPGGDIEEYIMLRLRLNEGLGVKELKRRFGIGFELFDGSIISSLLGAGYIVIDSNAISLTQKGFLVSNSVISTLLYKESLLSD